jgi:hypothetical protein
MTATVWIQSHRPDRAEVIMGLLLPQGWKSRQAKQRFALDPGQGRETTFDLDLPVAGAVTAAPPPKPPAKDEKDKDTDKAAAEKPTAKPLSETPPAPKPPADPPTASAGPPYTIQVAATVGEEWVRRSQPVWPAVIPQRTVETGYGLAEWDGIQPVVVQNQAGDVRAEVRAAWDAKFFYFAAAVHRSRQTFRAGRFASDGDAIQLAWGLQDRADDDFGLRGRDRGLPAGAFRDTDHLMAVTFGKDGAAVVRLRGPRVALRDHLPGNQDPWYGTVEGARADIARDADKLLTIYEAAIPLAALAPLKAERGRTVRFGFRIGDGAGPPLEWSRAAGVPDYLAGPGSFLPIGYAEGLPCQTTWLMTGPAPGAKTK